MVVHDDGSTTKMRMDGISESPHTVKIAYYIYMSHRKNPGNTKYVLDGHWFMEIDGNC
jgi:hypothetical protein